MNTRDALELKPCPFCGEEPIVQPKGRVRQYMIYCANDECMGPHSTAQTEQDALVQWNTRATPATEEGIAPDRAEAREKIAKALCCPEGCMYPDRCCAQSVQRLAHFGKQIDAILSAYPLRDEAEPTTAMIDAGVAFALNVSLSGEYRWSQYVADFYKTMRAAAIREGSK